MKIIREPIITEKMNAQSESMGRYGFVVDPSANKIQIKKAVEEMYSVTVEAVKTMNYYGKKKSRYTKTGFVVGRKPQRKKAVVFLKKGETIDFFSNI